MAEDVCLRRLISIQVVVAPRVFGASCKTVMVLGNHRQSLTSSNTTTTRTLVWSRDEDNERIERGRSKSLRKVELCMNERIPTFSDED